MTEEMQQARKTYRVAWETWLLTSDTATKRHLERVMDGAQGKCVSTGGPGKEWEDFTKSLPGYNDWWSGWHADMMAKSNDIGKAEA